MGQSIALEHSVELLNLLLRGFNQAGSPLRATDRHKLPPCLTCWSASVDRILQSP